MARCLSQDERSAEEEMRRARKEKKMDKFLDECFVACVVKSSGEGLLHMPMKGTILYTEFMRPCRPAGTNLDVKLSSFKALRKFLEHLEEDGKLTLKAGASDPQVLTIHYDHPAFGLPPAEAWKKGCKLTGPISFGPKASRGLPPLSLGSLSLKPAWKPSWARSAKEAEDSDTQSTVALTSRSAASTLGDESSSNCGSASVERNGSKTEELDQSAPEKELEELDQSVAEKELECEGVQEAVTDTAEQVIWLDSCGWTAGDFTTGQAWNYNMTWGSDEVSLAVEKGESLHVSKIEGDWANAASASSGRNGWMPSAILQRVVHTSIAPFSGGPGYMKIEKGDRLAVFHRDADWVYGACLRSRIPQQQALVEESSLVRSEQVHAEGWFPSSCTEWPCRA